MADKDRRAPNRIPVRFVDGGDGDEQGGIDGDVGGIGGGDSTPGVGNDSGLTSEEIGRESAYEDETETRRRINRGGEQDSEGARERADDADDAGSNDASDLPRGRNDLDTTAPHAGEGSKSDEGHAGHAPGETPRHAASSGPAVAELVATRAELRRIEAELKKYLDERQEFTDKLARRQADFENYRKRVERERGETYNRTVAEVVTRLFPVLDNLRRALDAESSFQAGESAEFRHFLHGIELIGKQLNGVLEELGVEVVPTVGEPFDPHVHEAVTTEETDEFEPDTVMEEMRSGYRLGGKLLRPAMVKVATRA
ncbi:MAG: nucleotide exchange factor GrpE [Acidobacteria bacterium]|nr:nucleotide exchange factor GrpE [Acidobacteriota bacterium]